MIASEATASEATTSDPLLFYKKRHHQEYLKRIQERELQEKEKQETLNYVTSKLLSLIKLTLDIDNIKGVHDVLEELSMLFDDYEQILGTVPDLISHGLSLLENISNNKNICIQVAHENERESSFQLKNELIKILSKLGVETEGLDLEFDMDCTRDEEIARLLHEEQLSHPLRQRIQTPTPPPPPQPRRRGRPRKNSPNNI